MTTCISCNRGTTGELFCGSCNHALTIDARINAVTPEPSFWVDGVVANGVWMQTYANWRGTGLMSRYPDRDVNGFIAPGWTYVGGYSATDVDRLCK